jgi:dephospho-CoA kinase
MDTIAQHLAAGPFIVGLTGGIGSGKTYVADRFEQLGATVVDADAIAHALTGPGGAAMPCIASEFGSEVVAPDGRLDRAGMRERVFGDPQARQRLEAILHPMIREETERQIARASGPYVILVIPLLVESGNPRQRVDRVLVIDCPEPEQIERVMRRSQLAREQVLAIMSTQAGREQRLAFADDVIDNGEPGGTAQSVVQTRIQTLDAQYRDLAMAKSRLRGTP